MVSQFVGLCIHQRKYVLFNRIYKIGFVSRTCFFSFYLAYWFENLAWKLSSSFYIKIRLVWDLVLFHSMRLYSYIYWRERLILVYLNNYSILLVSYIIHNTFCWSSINLLLSYSKWYNRNNQWCHNNQPTKTIWIEHQYDLLTNGNQQVLKIDNAFQKFS